MLESVTTHRVNDETFVATGPIPPACIKDIYMAEAGGFRSMYVSTLTPKTFHEGGDVPTRGRSVEAKGASGGHAPARTPNVDPASGGNAPTRGQTLASGSYEPASGSRPHTPVEVNHYST